MLLFGVADFFMIVTCVVKHVIKIPHQFGFLSPTNKTDTKVSIFNYSCYFEQMNHKVCLGLYIDNV